MLTKLQTFKQFDLFPLTLDLARQYSADICRSLDQIPLVGKHKPAMLLAETKGGRSLHYKWQHSLIVFNGDNYAGVCLGYEREEENNHLYPANSIYLSDLAVAKCYQQQGLGNFIVKSWLAYNQEQGFLELEGQLAFSIQTNQADWNKHVQQLYESFGFKKRGKKQYHNRTDIVYWLEA